METKLTPSEIEKIGLIAIIRASEAIDGVAIARALFEGGIKAVEITLNTPSALDAIGAIRNANIGPGARIGAGTILEARNARAAIDAGAEYIVTPTLQPDTVELCKSAEIPVICGSLSPTEALAAHRAGADFIKIFPVETFGPDYVRAILAPLPFLKVIPTGGVTLKNLKAWFDAGSVAVGVGSELVSKQLIMDQDWDELRATAQQFARALATIRVG